MWNARYAGRFRRWGTARVVQGDSRRLLDVAREAGVCVSSPPYAEALSNPSTNPEYTGAGGIIHPRNYGSLSANLGNLPARDADFAAVVSSPPFGNQVQA